MYKDEIEEAINGYDMEDVLGIYDLDDIANYLSNNDYYVYKEDPTVIILCKDEVDEVPEVDVTAIAYEELHAGSAKARDFLTDILGMQHTAPTAKILAKVAELIL